ncbi:hypothetical protein ACS0TY_003190 [Phlomoides rotata]
MASQTNQNSPPRKRISANPHLPEDVIENILSFLPLKDLCGLSILSKRFRLSWKICRDLSFDRDFARNLSKEEYKTSVNSFFSNYSTDSAERFKLYYDATAETPQVTSWIEKAVALKVTEFELDFTPSKRKFTLSYHLVNAESIRVMKLINCELHLPFESKGLRSVRELTFQDVRARPCLMHSIFVNCVSLRTLKLIKCSSVFSFMASGKALETLVMKDCSDVHSVIINSPSLSTFLYHGKMTVFNFYCVLRLNDVVLDIAHPRSFQVLTRRNEMMNSLTRVEALTVSSTFLEGLSARFEGHKYKDTSFLLMKLNEFHLIVAPESFVNPSDVAIFLRKCPYIERVFIDLGKNAFGSSLQWETFGRKYLREWQIVIPYLKHVKIKGFTGKELPIVMARFFLKNAINLRSLVLVKARTHYMPQFYGSECLSLGILSNAVIAIYDHHRDLSSVMPRHSRDV